jgi:hypothetical protein
MAGLLFGLGLLLSGMSNPAKVLGFLDVTGQWDPSLMLVMGGAIAIGFFAFRRAERQSTACWVSPCNYRTKAGSRQGWCWAVPCSASAGVWPASARARSGAVGMGLAAGAWFVSPCCWACGWRAR